MKPVLFLAVIFYQIGGLFVLAEEKNQHQLLQSLATRTMPPSFAEITSLKGVRFAEFQKVLGATDKLAQKRGIIWAMSMNESRQAGSEMRRLIINDYRGRTLNKAEEQTLLDCVRLLGFSAHHEDDAFEFLSKHVEPGAWAKTRTWKSNRGDYANDLLTSFSIQAIGISDRTGTGELLKTLQNRSNNYLHRFAGDIVQANFYRYIREQHGERGLQKYLAEPDEGKLEFDKWKKTNGREYYDWANDKMRGPLPAE